MRRVTHKEVMGSMIRIMSKDKEFTRYDAEVLLRNSRLENNRHQLFVDLLYEKRQHLYAFEVKPSYALSRELLTGIGQCAFSNAMGALSYLVIVDEMWFSYLYVLSKIDWLGIIIYNHAVIPKFIIRQQPFRKHLTLPIPDREEEERLPDF